MKNNDLAHFPTLLRLKWAVFALLVSGFLLVNGQASGPPIGIGAKVTLIATADGFPAPTFVWKKDGVPVSPGNGIEIYGDKGDKLVIVSFKPENEGTYVVYASNVAGTANSADEVLTITSNGVPVERARTELRTFTYDYRRESKTETPPSRPHARAVSVGRFEFTFGRTASS